MYDTLLVTQASQTVTNSATGTALDLKTGTPKRGLKMRFVFTAVSNASGSATITPIVEHSDDNSTWTTHTTGSAITTTTTNTPTEQFLPVTTDKRYVRGSVTFSATTGTPTCTYHAELGNASP